jgi:hypothetical protein
MRIRHRPHAQILAGMELFFFHPPQEYS